MDTLPLLLFFLPSILLISQKVVANEITNVGAVGAIVDQSCRNGKEAKVAMDIAIKDVYHKLNHSFYLHTINSERSPILSAFAAKDLINKQKVQAIIGPQTWEEAQLVADIGNRAHVPVLSLADATPPWAADRWPFLVQAAPNSFIQMKAIAAIIESWEWHRVTVIYEDTESSTAGIIPHLYDALRNSSVEIANLLPLPPYHISREVLGRLFSQNVSSSSMTEELEMIKRGQCRVILVNLSLPLSTKLFERATEMEMMQKDYVWIATDAFTNLVHSVNASSISSMQQIVGVKSYFPKNEPHFPYFFKRFRKRFFSEFPDEDNHEPGIYAVQAYDAVWTVCQAMIESNYQEGKLLHTILGSKFQGLNGKIEFIDRKLAPLRTFQIINVVGKSYSTLGYWSDAFKFSKRVDGKVANNSSMKSLVPVLWPGFSLTTPRGWAIPTEAHPLRIGVPNGSVFEEFLTVSRESGDSFGGYVIDLFHLTVQNLPYFLPYKFFRFNDAYDDLVRQIYLKKFDAVVGDVTIVSKRFEYAEFTQPYTQPGMVMIVPVRKLTTNKALLFMKPFTKGMWVLTGVITIYNGFVIWLIERKYSSELRGSALDQIGTLIWLSFSTLFYLHGEKLHSNLSRMAMVVWLVVALVLTQTYTANLSSILTIQKLEPTVTNIETLQNSNSMVGCCNGSFLSTYLVDVVNFKRNNIKKYSSANEFAEALRTKEIAAVFLEVPLAKLFVAKYCKEFIIAGPTFKVGGFGFVFPRGSELIPDINKSLLNLSETGNLRNLENQMLEREKCEEEDSDDQETSSISFTSYWVLFLVTGATSTVALMVYVVHCCQKLEDSFSETTWKLMFSVIKHRVSRKVSDVESSTNLS
ncbi:hypothetical protein ACOSQ4_031306 [Xanthoceras sorbifolium]